MLSSTPGPNAKKISNYSINLPDRDTDNASDYNIKKPL